MSNEMFLGENPTGASGVIGGFVGTKTDPPDAHYKQCLKVGAEGHMTCI